MTDPDITERLRHNAEIYRQVASDQIDPERMATGVEMVTNITEAADLIDTLRARIDELEAGLLEAGNCILAWARTYASPAERLDGDLEGDIQRIRTLVGTDTDD